MHRETTGVNFSYYDKKQTDSNRHSDFHKTCVPQQRAAAVQVDTKHKETEYTECDVVTQDTIWKQAVETEKRGTEQWKENWGFLTEYDPKGRPKTAKELPTEVNMYSENVPNTNSGNYGSRLDTEVGQTMQSLEFRFNSQNRKKKLGNDLVCY